MEIVWVGFSGHSKSVVEYWRHSSKWAAMSLKSLIIICSSFELNAGLSVTVHHVIALENDTLTNDWLVIDRERLFNVYVDRHYRRHTADYHNVQAILVTWSKFVVDFRKCFLAFLLLFMDIYIHSFIFIFIVIASAIIKYFRRGSLVLLRNWMGLAAKSSFLDSWSNPIRI